MDNETVVDDDWDCVAELLPSDLDASARAHSAFSRPREIASATDLLRICFAYGFCDKSLRETAAWAEVIGLASVSNPAVYKRLAKCGDWLAHLIVSFMQERGMPTPTSFPVRVVDASVLCKPGSTGTDYRLHIGIDLGTLQLTSVELTGAEGGETFRRHSFAPGEVALGDRGYAQRGGVASVLQQDAHVVVRINWQNFPLLTPGGHPFDIIEHLSTLKSRQCKEWQVAFEDDGKSYPVRLVATKLCRKDARDAQKRIRKEAKGEPHPNSLEAAKYVMVITDLPATVLPPREAIELYRLRWQVELYFKRLKSILHADKLRAKSEHLARTYIYTNILAALIIDELGFRRGFFSQSPDPEESAL